MAAKLITLQILQCTVISLDIPSNVSNKRYYILTDLHSCQQDGKYLVHKNYTLPIDLSE